MVTMRRLTSLLAAFAVACSLATSALAQPLVAEPPSDRPPPEFRGGSRHGPPPVEVLGEQAERLGLDAKTRDGVRAVIKDSRAEADRLREEIADAREAMRELLENVDMDEPAVMRQADKVGALELEEYKNWLRAMVRIRGLLTPEQRIELVKMRKELFAQVFAGSRAACSGDIERFCSGRHGDEQIRACMRRYRDDVSDTCRGAIAAEFAKRRKNL
jgi:Spy/CpxP family protein refolding chaperone